MQHRDEKAGHADAIANAGATLAAAAMEQDPPEEEARDEEAEMLQAVRSRVVECQPIEWRCVPDPECEAMQRGGGDGMADRAPAGRNYSRCQQASHSWPPALRQAPKQGAVDPRIGHQRRRD